MKSYFFPLENQRKKGSLRSRASWWYSFYGLYDIYICHPAFLRALRYARLTVFCSFLKNLGSTRACRRSFGITSICPSLRLSSPRPQSTSTAPNSQQQEFDKKQQHHPPANSSTPKRPESITPGNCLQPGFTACSARESTSTEKSGPKLIGYTGTIS